MVPRVVALLDSSWREGSGEMFAESEDDEQLIERVAALDIGKAELVCCVRLPAPVGGKRRVQEVTTALR